MFPFVLGLRSIISMLFMKMAVYACSKGRPTKALTKKRLECPEQIEEELAGLRKDFLLNNKCKMLVLVSMATDEMIRLVSMYPEVWFMDTTASECISFRICDFLFTPC